VQFVCGAKTLTITKGAYVSLFISCFDLHSNPRNFHQVLQYGRIFGTYGHVSCPFSNVVAELPWERGWHWGSANSVESCHLSLNDLGSGSVVTIRSRFVSLPSGGCDWDRHNDFLLCSSQSSFSHLFLSQIVTDVSDIADICFMVSYLQAVIVLLLTICLITAYLPFSYPCLLSGWYIGNLLRTPGNLRKELSSFFYTMCKWYPLRATPNDAATIFSCFHKTQMVVSPSLPRP